MPPILNLKRSAKRCGKTHPKAANSRKSGSSRSSKSTGSSNTCRESTQNSEWNQSFGGTVNRLLVEAVEALTARVDAIERRWKVDPPDLTDKQIRDLEDGMPGVASFPQ